MVGSAALPMPMPKTTIHAITPTWTTKASRKYAKEYLQQAALYCVAHWTPEWP
jgi:hypothetical protein